MTKTYRLIGVDTIEAYLEGYIADDVDIDGEFLLTTDDGETFIVKGWAVDIEILQDGVTL